MDQIDRELELERGRLEAIIDNINREISERQRLEEEESYEKRIERIKTLIEYERDDANKIELGKELLRLQNDYEDWQWQ